MKSSKEKLVLVFITVFMLIIIGCGGGGGSTGNIDTTPPVLTLLGDNPMSLHVGDTYIEPGAEATDNVDGNLTSSINITGTVDTNTVGNYTIFYQVKDRAGNEANATRTVNVLAQVDTTPPVLTLLGYNPMSLHVGDTYTEPGAEAIDNVDGNLTSSIMITGTVDTNTAGSYAIFYQVSDTAGNKVKATRTIYVISNAHNSPNFPSAYYPTGNHPRLWLTSERLNAIQKGKAQNTERWQAFKALCDSIVDSDSSNDPWDIDNSPQNYTAPLALMYRIEHNSIYADKALELMDKVDDDLSKYGDPDHQSYYFLGLTYDWLYDYAGMTSAKKEQYRDLMKRISDKFYNEDLTASGTDSDFNLLTALHHLVMGIATYDGSDTNATEMLNRAWKGWSKGYCVDANRCTSNRGMVLAGLGGVYFTGMAYFPSTDIIGISGFEMSMKSACGYDVNVQEPELSPFWGNILSAIISLTEPARTAIFDYGSWQDPNTLSAQPWLRRALIISEYFATESNNTTMASLARGFGNAVNIGDYNDPFLEFFYDIPDGNATNPYTNTLPLVQYRQSPDFLLFRTGWDTDDSWGVFRGDGSKPLDQRGMDMGSFALWHNGSYLTKGARNYESLSHGDFYNTLSLQNNCTYNGNSCSGTAIFDSQEAATITRHRTSDSPLLAYAMLKADGQWDDNPTTTSNPVDNINTYRRHFVWMGKYAVIFDRIRANSAIDITYRLRALQKPTINGATVSQLSQNQNSRLLQRTLEPAGVTIEKVDESSKWSGIPDWVVNSSERHWQSTIDFTTDTLNIFNVIQIGDANMSQFDTLESLCDSNNSGVRIGNRVVVFNKSEELRSRTTYTIHNATNKMHHLIGDLIAGSYHLKIDGSYVKTVTVNESDNTAWFETSKIGDITISLGQ